MIKKKEIHKKAIIYFLKQDNIRLNIIIIGPPASGKSSLAEYFKSGRRSQHQQATMGCDSILLKVTRCYFGQPLSLNLTLADMGGQREFFEHADPAYFEDADGLFVHFFFFYFFYYFE